MARRTYWRDPGEQLRPATRGLPEPQRSAMHDIMTHVPWGVSNMRRYVQEVGYDIDGYQDMDAPLLMTHIIFEEFRRRNLW